MGKIVNYTKCNFIQVTFFKGYSHSYKNGIEWNAILLQAYDSPVWFATKYRSFSTFLGILKYYPMPNATLELAHTSLILIMCLIWL